jgi:ribonucleoside-diphosphate reductase alpha chain
MGFKFTNEILENIWKDRYSKNDNIVENNFKRVAKYCAQNEEDENEFYEVMSNVLFLPGGRTMSNSGIGKDLTLNNCFTAPLIKDDLTDIFQKVALGAKTHQKGGGIGYNFSQLRPKGSTTSNNAIASGAVSFMDVFNAQTATILQGNRRGANMGLMSVYNMDIEDFINAKSYEENKLNHFNITVMVDDDFINAVKENKNILLHYPVYDDNGFILKDETKWIYQKEVSAKYLWDLIIKKAYENGEPGIGFTDTMNKDNNLWYIENIVATNPCFEYLSGTVYGKNPKTGEVLDSNEYGGACNLGSLFLHNFVKNPFTNKASLDYHKLKKTIKIAIKFLDNIIDINKFPDKIYENYQKSFRTIGMGVTGLSDMLCMLGYKYNSKEAQDLVDSLMNFISLNAYKSSISLAIEKGEFPFLDKEKYIQSGYLQKHLKLDSQWQEVIDGIMKHGIRNSKMISIAPTGTLSLTFGNNCSSGIEPIFSLSYDRKVKMGGQSEEDIKIVKMEDYAYYLWKNTLEDNVVKEDVFVTAMDMTVDEHIDMLKRIAFHVDMSVSKTINVPSDYSFEETKNIYLKCFDSKIKGCTIFRPNEIRKGILISNEEKNKNIEIVKEAKQYKTNLKRGDILLVNDDLLSAKRTIVNGCGKFYIHSDFDEDTGEQLETFIEVGSGGGCERNLQFISRLISLLLRSGVSVDTIIDQSMSIRPCKAYTDRTKANGDTSKGTSCPSAIGYALKDLNKKIQERCFMDIDLEEDDELEDICLNEGCSSCENKSSCQNISDKPDEIDEIQDHGICPECGAKLSFQGGCNICIGDENNSGCGWSKCS